MTERPKTPRDLARQMSKRSFRATAEYFAQRAKRQKSPSIRQRLAENAEHYRQLAQLEEEVAGIHPKPPAPSA